MYDLMKNITSPCIHVCKLMEDGLCIGCFRTREEIGHWSSYSDEERTEIMEKLDDRRKELYDIGE